MSGIYELARKHCGRQPTWRINAGLLQKKIGSQQDDKHFSAHLRELASSDDLPDYRVKLHLDNVIFTRREPISITQALAQTASPAPRHVPKVPDLPAPEASVDAALASFAAAVENGKRKIAITWKAMEQVSALAPGWDKYALEQAYAEWAADKDVAHNEDARFLAWVRSFTKGRAQSAKGDE